MTINELDTPGRGWGPAHTKNLIFFSDAHVADNLAMAVGDNFDPRSIRAYDWAVMAHEYKIASKLVVDVREKLWL